MILNRITSSLRLWKSGFVKSKLISSDAIRCDNELLTEFSALSIKTTQKGHSHEKSFSLIFAPRSIVNITPHLDIVKPLINDVPLYRIPLMPNRITHNIIDLPIKDILDCPSNENVIEKRAERLIVIRRRKMRKHKLRKLRKRMKFDWAKKKQRRLLKKEKDFQAVLISQIKEAEAFSPEKYITEKLNQANEIRLPKKWKGRRKPTFIIRQLMGLDPKINYKGF